MAKKTRSPSGSPRDEVTRGAGDGATKGGRLYVVASPIGNLGDLSGRAAETLAQCEAICAEDTRRTRKLLSHLGISGKPVLTLHAHSPERAVQAVLERLQSGARIAQLTDAGTPAVSDPGASLVRQCHERGIPVLAIPGPSAVTAAVSISGLVSGGFSFIGFFPRQGSEQKRVIAALKQAELPVVFFESPERIGKTLKALATEMPERRSCLCRELSKLFEEARFGTLAELAGDEQGFRGEITVVVEAEPPSTKSDASGAESDSLLPEEVQSAIAIALRSGARTKALARELAAQTGISQTVLYRAILEIQAGMGPLSG